MNRKKVADLLTGYVNRLRAGAVIGITAPWGEGKTWFGHHWAASLQPKHRVAFIDAFENDYIDDPFLLIASELAGLIEDDGASANLRKRATGVFNAIVPIGTKALINLAGRVLLGSQDFSKDVAEAAADANDALSEQGEKWLEDRFNELDSQRASLRGFKKALAEAVAKSETPVVVIIDELDRCRPSFAVTLIERLKHLFDVPNLVFVLLMNRNQLECSIEGHYGPGTDGAAYLGKFVNLWFELPRPGLIADEPDRRYKEFVSKTVNAYKVPKEKKNDLENFETYADLWARTWHMSLRDIERMCTLFVLAEMRGSPLLSYLIAIKVKDANLFSKLRKLDGDAHRSCAKELQKLVVNDRDDLQAPWPNTFFRTLSEFHLILADDLSIADAKNFSTHGNELIRNFHDPHRAFCVVAGWLDLPVEAF